MRATVRYLVILWKWLKSKPPRTGSQCCRCRGWKERRSLLLGWWERELLGPLCCQENGNRSTSRSSNCTAGQTPKRCTFIPQGHTFTNVPSSLLGHRRTWKQPRGPTAREWMMKMWYLYSMEEGYSAVLNHGILKITGKWKELQETLQTEVSQQPPKDKPGRRRKGEAEEKRA